MATKIYTTDLKVGMFVADLDRPWVDTPFLLQGFLVEDAEQIATLRAHCEYVIIDRARSVGDQFEAAAASVHIPLAPGARRPPQAPGAAPPAPSTRPAQAAPAPPAPRRAPAREGGLLRLEDVARRGRGPAAPTGSGEGDDGMLGRMVSGFRGLFGGG